MSQNSSPPRTLDDPQLSAEEVCSSSSDSAADDGEDSGSSSTESTMSDDTSSGFNDDDDNVSEFTSDDSAPPPPLRPAVKRRAGSMQKEISRIGQRRRVDDKVDATLDAVLEACEAVPIGVVEQRSATKPCIVLKTPIEEKTYSGLPQGKRVLLVPRGSNACDSLALCIEEDAHDRTLLHIVNESGKKSFESLSRERARNARLLCLLSYASSKEDVEKNAKDNFPKAWHTRLDAKTVASLKW